MKRFNQVTTFLWLLCLGLFILSAWSVAVEVLGLSGHVDTRQGVVSSVDVSYTRSSQQDVTTTNYDFVFTDESGNTYTPSLDGAPRTLSEGDTVTLGFVGGTLATVNDKLVEGVTPIMSIVFGTSLGLLVLALFMGRHEQVRPKDKSVSVGAAFAVALFFTLPAIIVGLVTIAISVIGKELSFAPWPICMIVLALGLGFFLRWRAHAKTAN
jgi:hypothetical protein